jgi:hypothetical protein
LEIYHHIHKFPEILFLLGDLEDLEDHWNPTDLEDLDHHWNPTDLEDLDHHWNPMGQYFL